MAPYVGAPEIKARRLVLAVEYHGQIGNPGYQGGLARIDATMRRRDGTRFLDAAAERQTGLPDALVEAERSDAEGDLGAGVSFFDWVRRMTVDAYHTSPIGIADVQYRGNAVLGGFEVP